MLAGCDDGTAVTRVDRLVSGVSGYVTPLALGGMAVEVHGAPFAGFAPAEVVARLRLPPSYPTAAGFRLAAPSEAERLVLDFNPATPGRAAAACAGEVRSAAGGRREGFSVTATLCSGPRVVTTGHLEARRARADDPAAFAQAMSRLFLEIFSEG